MVGVLKDYDGWKFSGYQKWWYVGFLKVFGHILP